MSELKVNTISSLGDTVKINNPVGIGGVNRTGYQLSVEGKVNMEGSVEVVTVPASNFGVRIRAPLTATTSPGFGDSTLQFTNNQGSTEWASLHAKSDRSLQIITNNNSAMEISPSQVINHLGSSLFTNTATFSNTSQFNGQATFADAVIPKCGGVPTLGSHLVNLDYLNSAASKVYSVGENEITTTVSKTIVVAKGTYSIATFVGFDLPSDVGGEWTANLNIQVSGSGITTTTIPHSTRWTKTGGGGHGRTFAGSQMGFATITVPNQTTLTITGLKSATAYNSSTYNSWVALLIKS